MRKQNDVDDSKAHFQDDLDNSFLAYIQIITKHHKMILYIVGAGFLLSILISFTWPRMYQATARVLPPQESTSGIASLISKNDELLSGLAGNFLTSRTSASLYVGIMKSQSVVHALNKKFNLKKLYGLKYIEDVAEELDKRSTIVVSKKDRIISVSIRDRDPVRAADIANAYVDILDKLNRSFSSTEGKRKRIFLESRLKEVRDDMESAEQTLKLFQEKYHLFSVEEQAKVAIQGVAEIKGQIIAAKTELEVLKEFGTEKQVEALMLKAKINELQKQLSRIEGDGKKEHEESDITNQGADESYYIPLGRLPDLSMKLIRLMRDAKIQEKLFELLSAQYEMAQIEEAKDVDTIQVLDSATPPEKKYSPKAGIVILASLVISAVFAVLLSLVLEYYESIRAQRR